MVEQTGLGVLSFGERESVPKNVCGGGHVVRVVGIFEKSR